MSEDVGTEPAAEQAVRRGTGWRRAVRRLALAVAAVVVVLLVAVAVLWTTTADPRASSPGWTRLADLPAPRGEVATAATPCTGAGCDDAERILVLGGIHGLGNTSDAVDVYDLTTSTWRAGPPLPDPRHHAAAASLDGTVYVTGGAASTTDWDPAPTVWTLASGASGWEPAAPMPEGRLGHALVALDGRLYAVGGEGPSADTLVFEPETGWSRAPALPTPRDHLGAAVLDGRIWAVGGRAEEPLARVDVFDPDRGAWRDGPALPVGFSAAAVGRLDDGLHVVGGEDPDVLGGGVIDRHVVLRPEDQAWEDAPQPLVAVHGAAGTSAGGSLFVAGGSRRQGSLSVLGWTGLTASYTPPAR